MSALSLLELSVIAVNVCSAIVLLVVSMRIANVTVSFEQKKRRVKEKNK